MTATLGRGDDSDEALVRLARSGERAAFGVLVERHQQSALVLCQRLLGDVEASQDAVQEAVLASWLNLDRLIQPESFGSWLSGIALNMARQALKSSMAERRRASAAQQGQQLDESPEELAEMSDISRHIRAAVNALSPGQRDAVYLFYISGLTHKEAAAELGVSVSAVKARLHHARANLGRSLVDLRPQEPTMSTTTDFVDVRIVDVRASNPHDSPRVALVLLETPEGDRHLPIFIGIPEATALAFSLENVEMPRPMTYQFAASLLTACEGRVTEVRIDKLVEITYFATVIVETTSGYHEMDARPSDALNLAALANARITTNPRLLHEPGDMTWWNDLGDRTEIVEEAQERQTQAMESFTRRRPM